MDKLILFSRYPVPGSTKTRLIPYLGALGAADLQRRLTERTIRTIRSFLLHREIEMEIHFEGGSKKKMRQWLRGTFIYKRQVSGNIGDRMESAFLDAFQSRYRRVILMGADIPEIKTEHLIRAYDLLTHKDLVLGPSVDGGYWLIGCKRPVDLFHDIEWGAKNVLKRTLSKADKNKLTYQLLEPLNDMDTIEDVKNWDPAEARQNPFLSVIIPTLNEEKKIQHTIRHAMDKSAEIIVVDGGSDDHTVRLAKEAGARVIQCKKGRTAQQNRGFMESKGKVLLFLHSDTILPKGYSALVFENLMDSTIILGAFRFKTDVVNPFMRIIEYLVNFRSVYLKLPYGDQALFMRKSSFQKVGGFPDVEIAEDLVLVRKIQKLGKIRIVPASVITSGRRWNKLGIIVTTLINLFILVGCLVGVSPNRFSGIYQLHR